MNPNISITGASWLLQSIRAIHEEIRQSVLSACEQQSCEQMSQVADDGPGDTIYALDRISESVLVALFEKNIASRVPIILIAEGISGGKITLPHGTQEQDAQWRVIADPIDGTRCLMYQKRSGWILTGVASNLGESTTLADIELAVQTEIPLIKQHLSDTLWAERGSGAAGERFNRVTGERTVFTAKPSAATNLAHGFATVARFFAGGRDVLATVDDDIHFAALGSVPQGKAFCFEDQYLSTGGQLYELMAGHDRFVADLRPMLEPILKQRHRTASLCCHPYDLCTELIAREAGVIITTETGQQIRCPLDVATDVSWVGYANRKIQQLVEPLLRVAMQRHGLRTMRPEPH
jgi:fructose-1,6-bisphosphatase/inositol monophosphatase family enzyme